MPLLAALPAQADQTISSSGPLTNIFLSDFLNCQVSYAGDTQYEFYSPGSTSSSCATHLRMGGEALSTDMGSQSPVTGSGTAADPYRVITTTDTSNSGGTTPLKLTRTDTYVVGRDFYQSDVTVTNTGGDAGVVLWHAADCYLQDADTGYGFYDPSTGGIYCTKTPNNSPADRIEGFVPLSDDSRYIEGQYGTATVGPGDEGYPNTCECDQLLDNGMGLSWNLFVPGGQSQTRSFLTTFSPTGRIFDATPPDTVITGGPSGRTSGNDASFTFTASEPGSTFQCRVDGGAFVACGSPYTASDVSFARHTFEVRAMDADGNIDLTPAARAWTAVELKLADLPDPTLGKEFNIQTKKGIVLVGIPSGASSAGTGARASQKGITFVPLEQARQVPIGSFVDTTKGTVSLQSARNSRGVRQTGAFSGSLFQVLQSRKRKAKGLTDLRMKGSSFKSCTKKGKGKAKRKKARGKAKRSGVEATTSRRRSIRRLHGSGRGRFRTRGRHSAATVRGTIWDVIDRCDGTLTKVKRGTVAVFDFRRKKTIVVKAGKSYLAKAKGPKKKSRKKGSKRRSKTKQRRG